MFQHLPVNQRVGALVVVGPAHRDHDAPQLALLQPPAGRAHQEVDCERPVLVAGLLRPDGLAQQQQDLGRQGVELARVRTYPGGDSGGVPPGQVHLGEELDRAEVERIVAEHCLDPRPGPIKVTEHERLFGRAEIPQRGMPRVRGQRADHPDLVGLEDRRRVSLLPHQPQDRGNSLSLRLRELHPGEEPGQRLVPPPGRGRARPQNLDVDSRGERAWGGDLDAIGEDRQPGRVGHLVVAVRQCVPHRLVQGACRVLDRVR